MKSTSSIQENSHEFINDNEQYIVFTEGERSIVNREFKHTYKNLDIPLEAKNKIEEIFKIFDNLNDPKTLKQLAISEIQSYAFSGAISNLIELLNILEINCDSYDIELRFYSNFDAIKNKEYSDLKDLIMDIIFMIHFYQNILKKKKKN